MLLNREELAQARAHRGDIYRQGWREQIVPDPPRAHSDYLAALGLGLNPAEKARVEALCGDYYFRQDRDCRRALPYFIRALNCPELRGDLKTLTCFRRAQIAFRRKQWREANNDLALVSVHGIRAPLPTELQAEADTMSTALHRKLENCTKSRPCPRCGGGLLEIELANISDGDSDLEEIESELRKRSKVSLGEGEKRQRV